MSKNWIIEPVRLYISSFAFISELCVVKLLQGETLGNNGEEYNTL